MFFIQRLLFIILLGILIFTSSCCCCCKVFQDTYENNKLVLEGDALVKEGKYEEAINCYDEALKFLPGDVDTLIKKGAVLEKSGKIEKAIDCYEKVLKKEPENVVIIERKADALVFTGKKEKAADEYEKAALISYKDKKYDMAIEYFDKVMELEPDNLNALRYKGEILSHQKKYDKGIEYFDKFLRIEPKNKEILVLKGNALRKSGDNSAALNCYKKALQVDSGYEPALNEIEDLEKEIAEANYDAGETSQEERINDYNTGDVSQEEEVVDDYDTGEISQEEIVVNNNSEAGLYYLYDEIICGNFKYVFTGYECYNSIGNEFFYEQAQNGALFVVVTFEQTNISKENQPNYINTITLLDEQEREFTTTEEALRALMMSDRYDDCYKSDLSPGIKYKAALIYEIPEDLRGLHIKIYEGLWGSDKVVLLTQRGQ